MPEIEVVTDVAGRVCALAVRAGSRVTAGDNVVVVEAMKMEIPATAPATGTITSISVDVDDIVSEGQVVAILQT